MENLRDILKRIRSTRMPSNGVSHTPDFAPPPPIDIHNDYCAICGGKGFYTMDVAVGHPSFGQLITCECQQEKLSDELTNRLLLYSNLGYMRRFTFDNLREDFVDDAVSRHMFIEAFAAAARYAENPSGWLVFVGPSGSGKTHLAAAIANRFIETEHVVLFMHVPDLLDHLRSTYAPSSELTYNDMYSQVVDAPILILDGLGAHSSTPWAQEKLQQIINHRFNAELPTVVTTSNSLNEIDPYIRSRLESKTQSQVIHTLSPRPISEFLGSIQPAMLKRMTFTSFDVRGNNPRAEQQGSLAFAKRAAENFATDPDGWLTLLGGTGVGKTHLAVAIANDFMQKGQPMFFAFVPELLDHLRAAFAPESRVRYDGIFDEVKNTHLLILDDLGREHSTPWAEEKLYQIIVHRHNARLATVITSGRNFSERIGLVGSRIRDPYIGQLIRIDAPDYRIKCHANTHDQPYLHILRNRRAH